MGEKMGRKSSHFREEILSSMEVPGDLACQDVLLSVTGNRQICLENYKSILGYTEGEIHVLTKNGSLRILGSHLEICSYREEEMLIKGHVREIRFLDS
jgi:sporulation protein YqfC